MWFCFDQSLFRILKTSQTLLGELLDFTSKNALKKEDNIPWTAFQWSWPGDGRDALVVVQPFEPPACGRHLWGHRAESCVPWKT